MQAGGAAADIAGLLAGRSGGAAGAPGQAKADPLCAREAAALSDRLTDRQLASLADMLAQYAGECDYNVGVGQVLGAVAVRWEELL